VEQRKKIIILSDIIQNKVQKEQELARYNEELVRIQKHIAMLQSDLSLTQLIIDMIEQEKIIDMQEYIIERNKDKLITKDE
tara:strand:- start:1448 stop:1690 length:243 start_codon:yes stop_codon:yes gene_type:complete